MAVQVDQISGVGTLTKAGDFVDMVVGLHGRQRSRSSPLNPRRRDSITDRRGAVNSTQRQGAAQGVQVVGHAAPAAARRHRTTEPTPARAAGAETILNGQQQIVILAVPTQQSPR